jgi:hypothetical protein
MSTNGESEILQALLGIRADLANLTTRTGAVESAVRELTASTDARFRDVSSHFREIDARFREMDARFREMEAAAQTRHDAMIEVLAGIKGEVRETNRRLDHVIENTGSHWRELARKVVVIEERLSRAGIT